MNRPSGIAAFAAVGARAAFAVVVQRDDEQRLDNRPRVVRLNHDDPAFADGNHFRMRDGQRPPIRQKDIERLERLTP